LNDSGSNTNFNYSAFPYEQATNSFIFFPQTFKIALRKQFWLYLC